MIKPHRTWFISFAKFSFPGLFTGPVGSPKTCAEQQWSHSFWMCMSCCTTPEVWKEKITIMCRHFCRCVLNSQTSPAVLPQLCIASATDTVCEVPLPSVMCGSSSSTLYSKALLNWPLQPRPLVQAPWFCSSLSLCLDLVFDVHVMGCMLIFVHICVWMWVLACLAKDSLGCCPSFLPCLRQGLLLATRYLRLVGLWTAATLLPSPSLW